MRTALADILEELREAPLSYAAEDLARFPTRKRRALARPGGRSFDAGFLFEYDVFPRRLLRFLGQWQVEGREMRPGDVIAQEALGLGFGVRVLEVRRDDRTAVLRYGTLLGHPETGENEFRISADPDGVWVEVTTTARAGLFSRAYAGYCNRKALRRMKEAVR